MNWGKWIIVAFVAFAGFIATLVVVCVKQDISLVSKDYYKEELNYDQQIARLTNADELTTKPYVVKTSDALVITYPDFSRITKGELKLFRPSDSKLDKSFTINPANGETQAIDIKDMPRGMYKAQLQWSMNGKEYFIEEIINL